MTVTTHSPTTQPPPTRGTQPALRRRRLTALAVVLVLLLVALCASVFVGTLSVDPARVVEVLRHPDDSHESFIVNTLRLDRTWLGLSVGVALGVAGAVMQQVTRNPLADPGLLGVNAGASLAIVLGAFVAGLSSIGAQVVLAMIGALVATGVVYTLGMLGHGGGTPVRITLVGVALAASLTGITSAVLLLDQEVFNTFRYWDVGALTRDGSVLGLIAPLVVAGVVGAVALIHPFGALALGDDIATALGINVLLTRTAAVVVITVLCGAATAAAGPISFLGLMVPLVAAWLIGSHPGWIIALSGPLGATVLLTADIVGRLLVRPAELQVGIVTTFVGAPVLLVMVFRLKGARS